jgi:hypothetical protein
VRTFTEREGRPLHRLELEVFAFAVSTKPKESVNSRKKSGYAMRPLMALFDSGCAKTPQAQKRGEWISQINQDWGRSEIVIAPNAIRGEERRKQAHPTFNPM